MNEQCALILEAINFSFEEGKSLFFSNLSTSFARNKMHFIQGKNGSGKSTLFRIISGNIDPHESLSGTLRLGSQSFMVTAASISRLPLANVVKLVHQDFDVMLADQFSFNDNLRLASLDRYPNLAPMPSVKKLPDLIHRFDIDYDKPVHLLSGGQRQILTILMALQKETHLLLLDEPTATLDTKNAAIVMDFLKSLLSSTDLTILIICHDNDLVRAYGPDQVYHLDVDTRSHKRTLKRHAP